MIRRLQQQYGVQLVDVARRAVELIREWGRAPNGIFSQHIPSAVMENESLYNRLIPVEDRPYLAFSPTFNEVMQKREDYWLQVVPASVANPDRQFMAPEEWAVVAARDIDSSASGRPLMFAYRGYVINYPLPAERNEFVLCARNPDAGGNGGVYIDATPRLLGERFVMSLMNCNLAELDDGRTYGDSGLGPEYRNHFRQHLESNSLGAAIIRMASGRLRAGDECTLSYGNWQTVGYEWGAVKARMILALLRALLRLRAARWHNADAGAIACCQQINAVILSLEGDSSPVERLDAEEDRNERFGILVESFQRRLVENAMLVVHALDGSFEGEQPSFMITTGDGVCDTILDFPPFQAHFMFGVADTPYGPVGPFDAEAMYPTIPTPTYVQRTLDVHAWQHSAAEPAANIIDRRPQALERLCITRGRPRLIANPRVRSQRGPAGAAIQAGDRARRAQLRAAQQGRSSSSTTPMGPPRFEPSTSPMLLAEDEYRIEQANRVDSDYTPHYTSATSARSGPLQDTGYRSAPSPHLGFDESGAGPSPTVVAPTPAFALLASGGLAILGRTEPTAALLALVVEGLSSVELELEFRQFYMTQTRQVLSWGTGQVLTPRLVQARMDLGFHLQATSLMRHVAEREATQARLAEQTEWDLRRQQLVAELQQACHEASSSGPIPLAFTVTGDPYPLQRAWATMRAEAAAVGASQHGPSGSGGPPPPPPSGSNDSYGQVPPGHQPSQHGVQAGTAGSTSSAAAAAGAPPTSTALTLTGPRLWASMGLRGADVSEFGYPFNLEAFISSLDKYKWADPKLPDGHPFLTVEPTGEVARKYLRALTEVAVSRNWPYRKTGRILWDATDHIHSDVQDRVLSTKRAAGRDHPTWRMPPDLMTPAAVQEQEVWFLRLCQAYLEILGAVQTPVMILNLLHNRTLGSATLVPAITDLFLWLSDMFARLPISHQTDDLFQTSYDHAVQRNTAADHNQLYREWDAMRMKSYVMRERTEVGWRERSARDRLQLIIQDVTIDIQTRAVPLGGGLPSTPVKSAPVLPRTPPPMGGGSRSYSTPVVARSHTALVEGADSSHDDAIMGLQEQVNILADSAAKSEERYNTLMANSARTAPPAPAPAPPAKSPPAGNKCTVCGLANHSGPNCSLGTNGVLDSDKMVNLNAEQFAIRVRAATQGGYLKTLSPAKYTDWVQIANRKRSAAGQSTLVLPPSPPAQPPLKTNLVRLGDQPCIMGAHYREDWDRIAGRTPEQIAQCKAHAQLLARHRFSKVPITNELLIYLSVLIRNPTDEELVYLTEDLLTPEGVFEMVAHDGSAEPSEVVAPGPAGSRDFCSLLSVGSQLDDGSALTLLSPEAAEHLQLPLIQRHDLVLHGIGGTTTPQYSGIVVLEMEGIGARGQPVRFKLCVQAMVEPTLKQNLLIGTEVIARLDMTSNMQTREVTCFNNYPEKRVRLRMTHWPQVQAEFVRQGYFKGSLSASAHTTFLSEGEGEVVAEADINTPRVSHLRVAHLLGVDSEALRVGKIALRGTAAPRGAVKKMTAVEKEQHHTARIDAAVQAKTEDPLEFLCTTRKPFTFLDVLCVLCLITTLGLSFLNSELLGKVLGRNAITPSKLVTETTVGRELHKIWLPVMEEAMERIEYAVISGDGFTVTPRNAAWVHSVAMQVREDEERELEEAQRRVDLWVATRCGGMEEYQRPEQFPEEYWPLVAREERARAVEEYKRYPPERVGQLVEEVRKLSICIEDDPRKLEEPLVRAQGFANLSTWGHPNPDNPPSVREAVARIRLIDPNMQPIYAPPRRYSELETYSLRYRTEKMSRRRMLRHSTSAWNHPILMVANQANIDKFFAKHGDRAMEEVRNPANKDEVISFYRMTSDMRSVNRHTEVEPFPLPNIVGLLDSMRGSDRYSTTDVEDAFYTILMDNLSSSYTAFTTPDGRFEYTVMVQGAVNSASIWARVIHKTLEELNNLPIKWYQDDIVNHASGSIIEHLDTQQRLYNTLRRDNMTLKRSKTFMNFRAQKILGHIVSKRGREADPETISAITSLRPPQSVSGVRQVLGLAQVVREYVPEMGRIIAPIQQLSGSKVKDIRSQWGEPQDKAFAALKKALTTTPVLMLPDPTKPYRVQTDACQIGFGLGAGLYQQDRDGVWRPVAYWSRGLKPAERKRAPTTLECHAMFEAIMHWQVYLRCGQPFELITDHYALVYLALKLGGDPWGTLARMCTALQSFNFSVTHRAGAEHLLPDAVSRLFRYSCADVDERDFTLDAYRSDTRPLSMQDLDDLEHVYTYPGDYAWIRTIVDRHAASQQQPDNLMVGTAGEKGVFSRGVDDPLDIADTEQAIDGVLDRDDIAEGFEIKDEVMEELISHGLLCTQEETERRRTERASATATYEQKADAQARDWIATRLCEPCGMPERDPRRSHRAGERRVAWDDSGEPELGAGTDSLIVQQVKTRRSTETERLLANDGQDGADGEQETAGSEQKGTEEPSMGARRRPRRRVAEYTAEEKEERRRERDGEQREAAALLQNQDRIRREVARREGGGQVDEVRRRLQDEREERTIQEWDHLHQKLYKIEGSRQVYEVSTVFKSKRRRGLLMTVARAVHTPGRILREEDGELTDEREVLGEDGTLDLVNKFESQGCNPDPMPTDDADWLREQMKDEHTKVWLDVLSEPGMQIPSGPRSDDYYWRRVGPDGRPGVLMHHMERLSFYQGIQQDINITRKLDQIVVPRHMGMKVVEWMHDNLAHPGKRRTQRAIQQIYWWRAIGRHTRAHVNSCRYCQVRKADNRRAAVPVQMYDTAAYPCARVHGDLTGPFRMTPTGNKYILVMKCAFTKVVRLYPIVDKSAVIVAEKVLEFMDIYGSMGVFVTDRGSEFSNVLVKEMCELMGTRKVQTTAVNPRSDGLAENLMRTIKDMLVRYCNHYTDNWDEFLGNIAATYNSLVNEATGYTPFYLMFGRERPQPEVDELQRLRVQMGGGHSRWVTSLIENLMYTWDHVGLRIGRNEQRFDRRVSEPLQFRPYEVGQWVFLRKIPPRTYKAREDKERHKLSSKLQYRYVGPYYITQVISPVLYAVMVHGAERRCHAINMKPDRARRPQLVEAEEE